MIHNKSRYLTIFIFVSILVVSLGGNALFPLQKSGNAVSEVYADDESSHTSESKHGDAGEHSGHTDPFASILFELLILIVAAIIGRWGAGKLNQPSVLGELLIGVLIGNVLYWMDMPFAFLVMHMDSAKEIIHLTWQTGISTLDAAREVFTPEQLAPGAIGHKLLGIISSHHAPKYILMGIAIWIFSNLGVIMLLFLVGLESSVDEMMEVGLKAFLVAIIGVIVPFAMGVGLSLFLIPESNLATNLFIGSSMAATSVGITARVFKDLNKLQTSVAKLVLGAAVIDDILVLIILAVVVGIVTTGEFHMIEMVKISILSVAFVGGLIFLVGRFMDRVTKYFAHFERVNLALYLPLCMAFLIAWLANLIGLATIVGAFVAGLIISEAHFKPYTGADSPLMKVIAPFEALFAPIFFVLTGMQVNLLSFLDSSIVWLALAFSAAAIVSKLVSGIGAGKGIDKISVGIGMIPRGEVGLIFASIGKGLGVITDAVFSAIVFMVIATTLITPFGLKWSLFRKSSS